MSENTNNGGPAFPVMSDVGESGLVNYHHSGMTLRDYFAAKALTGLIGRVWADQSGNVPADVQALWAKGAYAAADAMIKARSA